MIELTGRLICATEAQADVVRTHLPLHIELTRAEPGCVRFEVTQTSDPLTWHVHEIFSTREAFEAHQLRVKASQWGRETAGVGRDYTVTATAAPPDEPTF